jgi:hypothetical protein
MQLGLMFGFLSKGADGLQIHNKIFEIRITNYFISMNKRLWRDKEMPQSAADDIICDGVFDMERCLTKFKKHYAAIFTGKDFKMLERDGKLIFLTYLVPLINGVGFYHFEPETRDLGKMDLVVDYLKQQFILELKIWRGDSRHEDAYRQLAAYLKSQNTDCGYLLPFDFRKTTPDFRKTSSSRKQRLSRMDVAEEQSSSPFDEAGNTGDDAFSESQWITCEGKRIFDVMLRVGDAEYM